MTHSEQLGELATALALAQSLIEGAKKDSDNPFFKSHYADLASIWDACRKQLTGAGLAVVQMPFTDGTNIGVQTILLHASGQWIESSVSAAAKDLGPQAVGSVITYLRRYALAAVAGVPQIDDDAEAATDHAPMPSQPTTTKTAEVVGGLRVTGVTEKAGTSKQGKPYIAYTIMFSDGRKASTFDVTLKDAATSFWKNTTPCEAVLTEKNGYLNLMELNIVRDLADLNLGF
jgi:hypothetical protein